MRRFTRALFFAAVLGAAAAAEQAVQGANTADLLALGLAPVLPFGAAAVAGAAAYGPPAYAPPAYVVPAPYARPYLAPAAYYPAAPAWGASVAWGSPVPGAVSSFGAPAVAPVPLGGWRKSRKLLAVQGTNTADAADAQDSANAADHLVVAKVFGGSYIPRPPVYKPPVYRPPPVYYPPPRKPYPPPYYPGGYHPPYYPPPYHPPYHPPYGGHGHWHH